MMNKENLNQLLPQAVEAILETMFFTSPLGPPDSQESAEPLIEARVEFHGPLSGALAVRISEPAAQLLAAGFLGTEEECLSPGQSGQVIGELANMLCGWLVSRIEGEEHFDLDAPVLPIPAGEPWNDPPPASQQSFALERGVLSVALYLGAPV